ncbi:choice-of-anchor Q domain-containing protein [Adhaeretor mobilis]|uniref:Calx-beta domain protein n=1 Tax=Adhaeretor mobilis TaxID=1930276 RepID=A0A517N1C9_9BACT|nr:choice-of-anchor Q domain-containing protein [Adhaeretor mobilis]QDT00818.1 Calx-beta domain protein [Adhaeretor mobilis]
MSRMRLFEWLNSHRNFRFNNLPRHDRRLGFEPLEARHLLATFMVTNTNDSGAGSLREAMSDANTTANVGGIDEIHFSIGSGTQSIQPLSPLPTITDPVAILGNTQPGFTGVPLIELDGASQVSGAGLRIDSGGSEIRGMVINRFSSHGIVLEFGGGNQVTGNYVGMNSTGQTILENEGNGIIIFESNDNEIGGVLEVERNVISGNALNGITIVSSSGTKIKGNYIGLDAGDGIVRGNEGDGIAIFRSPNTIVGGDNPGEGNVISGNKANGIVVFGTDSTESVIQGNTIGLDSTGMLSRGNTRAGVVITHEEGLPETGASKTAIGGFTPGAGNVISGNGRSGIELLRVHENVIQGNRIGLTSDGLGVRANGMSQDASFSHGIDLYDSFDNFIGGDDDDDGVLDDMILARNYIAGSIESGISIAGAASSGNVVRGNYIGTDINGLGASSTFGNGLSGVHIDTASNNTIGGVEPGAGNLISGNKEGIRISGSTSTANGIYGNVIGLDEQGDKRGNEFGGVVIEGAFGNFIGAFTGTPGTNPGNVISGNDSHGVIIQGVTAKENIVLGNLIGVNSSGEPAGNDGDGVFIDNAPDNRVGNTDFISLKGMNVISKNVANGIRIEGILASGNRIAANHIGVNLAGTVAAGNLGRGVAIIGAPDNFVEEGNVISGNLSAGVVISGALAIGNALTGNLIGVASNGNDPLGNLLHGIFVTQNASSNIIGDPVGDAGNVIAFNGVVLGLQGHGVVIESGLFNQIRKNSIHSNSGRGIDLNNDSFTVNDHLDVDGGANASQNFPVVSKVGFAGPVKTITWSLTGPALATFTFDFFASDSLDPSGFGEGKTYLNTQTAIADDNGLVSHTTVFDSSDQYISATATDVLGNTSEFSMVDTDGDALADAWELTGIDFDENGTIDLPLNSNPNHKDIFVEVDAMVGRAPDPGALTDVVAAFASAPNTLVQNPDGENGIFLHAALDETDVSLSAFPNKWMEASVVKLAQFGTEAERDDANAANILAAKGLTHRWSIFADTHSGDSSGGSSEPSSNDFFVSLGLWSTTPGVPGGMPGGTHQQQAGTFMHELGHTLGLGHGGDDAIRYKPNYHSVMNYIWQTPGQKLPTTGRPTNANEHAYFDSWVLDYSRQVFPDLDQLNLIESEGIGGDPGNTVRIQSTSRYVKEGGPVDWDKDGLFNETVHVTLTPDWRFGLTGHEDWSNLQYYFVESKDFADGASTTSSDNELTFELWQSLVDWHALPGDYNLSGTVDAGDLTEWQDTYGQAAISPFAYADGNGNSLIDGADFLRWQRNFGSDIDDPGQLQFLQPSYTVTETAGVFNVIVERIGGTQGAITVDYELEDGTALSTEDYVDASGTLSFADGQTSQFISVEIIHDESAESDEYFNITLSNPTGGASLGNPSTTTFTISETEPPIVVTNINDSGGGSLRRAIQTANLRPGADTITFDVGIFATPQTISLNTGEIAISEAVTIDATALANNVTIDANLLSRIFNITTTTGDFQFNGLTLKGGQTTGFHANSSDNTYSGGAIRSLTTGNLTLDSSTISGNSTAGYYVSGGGVFAAGDVTLTSSTISGNNSYGYGGGVSADGNVTLTNSTVSGNSSYSSGGGVSADGNVTLTGSTVSGNSVTGSYSYGGGVFAAGDVTLTGSTVSGNSGVDDGGGVFAFGNVTLTGSTVSGNSSFGDGGGVSSFFGNVSLTNSTVSGNSISGFYAYGGGVFARGNITLSQSTVTDNEAIGTTATGGGIRNFNGTIIIDGSIVAGNTAGGGMDDIHPGTGTLNVNFSLIEQTGLTITGTNNIIGQSASLAPLADNGGPTLTHALLADSPAIDAGDPNLLFDANEFDQRGAPFFRVFDDPAVGTGQDMGAYERQNLPGTHIVVDTFMDENDGDYSAGDLSLREAVELANSNVGDHTITFDPGVFATPQTILLTLGEIEITEAVTIDGPGQELLTIDAQQQSRIFHITAFTGVNVFAGDFLLAGLTLTGGLTTGDSNISGGSASSGGGAIRVSRGHLTIDQSTISGNSTTGLNSKGGGIHTYFADVTLTNSTVSGNSTAGDGAHGGGISSHFGTVTLTNSTVSGNSTTGDYASGGGIHKSVGALNLTNSTVSGNSTSGYRGRGGGISTSGAEVTLTNSTVSGNNTAGQNANGGGILTYGAIAMIHSTITANHTYHAISTGGGIWSFNNPITITNSIVTGNTAGDGMDDIRPGTGALDIDFSLIQQTGLTFTGTDNIIGQSADLGPLADNGGPTQTHALLASSPAIDAGDPSIVFNVSEFDQRGVGYARVENGRIDIGSFESSEPIGASANFDSDVVGGDFLAWQRGCGIQLPNALKADGDTENDLDVELGSHLRGNDRNSQVLLSDDLTAVAMAMEWIGQTSLEVDPITEDESTPDGAALDVVFTSDYSIPVSPVSADSEAFQARSDDEHQREVTWLSGELLERVFG